MKYDHNDERLKALLTRDELLRRLGEDIARDDDTDALSAAVLELVSNVAHATAYQPGSFAAAYEEQAYNLTEGLIEALGEVTRAQRALRSTEPPPEAPNA